MASLHDHMRDGKGRARPGPSSTSASPSRQPVSAVIGVVLSLIGVAASAVLGTQAHQHSSPAVMAFAAAVGSALGILVVVGFPRGLLAARGDTGGSKLPRDLALAALAGAAGLGLAPWLVMANRYTDAPPGSEVLFVTTSAWGALLAVALALAARDRILRAGGALLGLAGAAALVANWERPSSFSLLSRFPGEEITMLIAGLVWTALIVVLVHAAVRGRFSGAVIAAAFGGLAAAGALLGIELLSDRSGATSLLDGTVLAYAVACAVAAAGVFGLLRLGWAEGVAGAYLLAPLVVTGLIGVEQALGVFGPQPIVVVPAIASGVLLCAGTLLAAGAAGAPARARVDDSDDLNPNVPTPRGSASRVALALGGFAVLAGLVGIFLPTLQATASGLMADGSRYSATFDMPGYQVAGPWLALGIAVVALGLALAPLSWRARTVTTTLLTASAVAWYVAATTPLRTLHSFVPSEIQVDYGTEFARIVFEGGPSIAAAAAIVAALTSVAVTWVARRAVPAATQSGEDAARPQGSRGDRS